MNEKSSRLALIIFLVFGVISVVLGLTTRNILWVIMFAISAAGGTWAVTAYHYYTKGLKDAEGFPAGIEIFKDNPSTSFEVLQVDYQNQQGGSVIIIMGYSWNTGVTVAIVPNTLIVGWKPGDQNPTHVGMDASGEKVLLSRHPRK